MKETSCNNCDFLSITEEEQDLIKKRGGVCPPHFCNKYNKRVLHFPKPHPFINPCAECIKDTEAERAQK